MDVSLYSGKEFSKVETSYSDNGIQRSYLSDELYEVESHSRYDRDNYVTVEYGGCYMTVDIEDYEDRFERFSSLNQYIDSVVELRERVGRLEDENEELRNRMDEMSDRLCALEYEPGGTKYKEAEKDFYSKAK